MRNVERGKDKVSCFSWYFSTHRVQIMASFQRQTGSSEAGGWLVILNKSLADSELHRLLSTDKYRLRVSTGTLPHSCLFPQSSVAFMVVPVNETLSSWPPKDHHPELHKDLLKNFTEFSKLKHNCFILLCSAVFGKDEQRVLSLLQQRYFSDRLNFLPVHNSKECVECMISIAKVSCKPLSDIIRERFERVQRQFLSEETVTTILCAMGIEETKCGLLLDGCQGLSGMAKATQRDLQDYNINAVVANSVWNLLHGKD